MIINANFLHSLIFLFLSFLDFLILIVYAVLTHLECIADQT